MKALAILIISLALAVSAQQVKVNLIGDGGGFSSLSLSNVTAGTFPATVTNTAPIAASLVTGNIRTTAATNLFGTVARFNDATTTIVPSGTVTAIGYDSPIWNYVGDIGASSTTMTVPATGRYRISASLRMGIFAGGSWRLCFFQTNGVLPRFGASVSHVNSSSTMQYNTVAIRHLTAGDTIGVYFYQVSGNPGTNNIVVGSGVNQFVLEYLAP